ncbi:hypothetical protein [Spirochaeta isovalerica]|uniref:Uncharacterized protein n=1 Tax=Spirochaeta isovalerica TaxID=150 RepID=A0A841RFX5_9SPIO|nr:hypothetical protein [Spirochaeta isovalerica]MBB6482291.1 hypothetical protein [Spirochaeta isovalerica]
MQLTALLSQILLFASRQYLRQLYGLQLILALYSKKGLKMKKIQFILLVILIISCSNNDEKDITATENSDNINKTEEQNQKETDISIPLPKEEILKSKYLSKNEILREINSNILTSESSDSIILLNDTNLRYLNEYEEPNLDILLVYDSVENQMLLHPFDSLCLVNQGRTKNLDSVNHLSERLGEFYEYFYLTDFNNNGIKEIFGFRVTGISFEPEIWEYQNGEFINLFPLEKDLDLPVLNYLDITDDKISVWYARYGKTDNDIYQYYWGDSSNRFLRKAHIIGTNEMLESVTSGQYTTDELINDAFKEYLDQYLEEISEWRNTTDITELPKLEITDMGLTLPASTNQLMDNPPVYWHENEFIGSIPFIVKILPENESSLFLQEIENALSDHYKTRPDTQDMGFENLDSTQFYTAALAEVYGFSRLFGPTMAGNRTYLLIKKDNQFREYNDLGSILYNGYIPWKPSGMNFLLIEEFEDGSFKVIKEGAAG